MKKPRLVSMVCFASFLFLFFSAQIAFAQVATPYDINGDGVLDKDEADVVLNSNITLPAGEYFFNNLTIANNAVLTLEGDPTSAGAFKGVKINAVNLTITSGASISADMQGYYSGPGTPLTDYQAGASYGGVGTRHYATSTYGSAVAPTDLGSGGNSRGGGAIMLVISNLQNEGTISALGGVTSSGGSIYVIADNLSGSGKFSATGGGLYATGYYRYYGGGGRIALHYKASSFTGIAEANGGCGSLGQGYLWTCAGNGTVGFFDETNNNFVSGPSWRLQKNDSPFIFNKIDLKNNSKTTADDGVDITANELLVDGGSLLTMNGMSVINIPAITINGASTVTFSGGESLTTNTIVIAGNSILKIIPEKILSITIPNLTITTGSAISADEKGYGTNYRNKGPGAPIIYQAGASYGGVGFLNSATSTYGSEREPVDFGSAGNGSHPMGGGAIRLVITNTFTNDGIVSANSGSTSSGGSIYVTAKNLLGNGVFISDGGSSYCPNNCDYPGAGGRIAVYYENSSFTGTSTALAGMHCWSGCSRVGGNGTVVMEQTVPEPPKCTTDCFDNVLFLPGLEASRLYLDENGSENQLWEPNRPLDVEKLYMNEDGTSKNSGIFTRDIIKETNTPFEMGMAGQNIYKSFSNMMDGLVTDKKINRWEYYAYDWRQNVQDIVDNGTQHYGEKASLITMLQTLVETSKTGKVTIITHSNGGLLAKALLVKLQEMKTAGVNDLIDHIDVLIMIAAPQIGTASAVSAMLNGYDQAKLFGIIVPVSNARELGRNMPGAYGLLPSRQYINRMSASPIAFADNQTPSGVTTDFVNAYGNVIDSYSEYKDFLFGVEGRAQPEILDTLSPIVLSPTLFGEAESLHNKIDAWVPPSSMRVIEVAGWGLDTVASFQYYPRLSGCKSNFPQIGCTDTYTIDEKPIFTRDGDGTVVEPSAVYMNVVDKVWVNIPIHNAGLARNRDHSSILEVDQLDDFISQIIEDKDPVYNLVIKENKPIDTSNRLRISIHSPVTLGAYDSSGNFTGKICPTDSEFCFAKENIPNSSYLEFGEGKYLNLPEENMQRVVLQGTDTGTFTYESEKVMPDNSTTTIRFVDIPVTSQTTAEITTNPTTQTQELKLDVNGDNVTDVTIQPSDEFDPISYLHVIRKMVENLDITKARKNGFIRRIDNTIKAIEKGKIDKAKLKVERFENILERRIDRKDPKKPKPHQLTKADAEQLLLMLDTLLNNLN